MHYRVYSFFSPIFYSLTSRRKAITTCKAVCLQKWNYSTHCTWQVPADSSGCLFELNNKHLMTGPEGNSEFCFPRISMFLETKSRETLRFEGNKIHCSPRDQSLSDLLYSKTKRKQFFNNALRFQQQRSTFRG